MYNAPPSPSEIALLLMNCELATSVIIPANTAPPSFAELCIKVLLFILVSPSPYTAPPRLYALLFSKAVFSMSINPSERIAPPKLLLAVSPVAALPTNLELEIMVTPELYIAPPSTYAELLLKEQSDNFNSELAELR